MGLMVDAAPTPMPPMKRPAYMAPRLPMAADCMMMPMMTMSETPMRHHLRPNRSVMGEAMSAPRKQPAWRVETMLAERLAVATDLESPRPKSWMKGGRTMTPPMTDESQPKDMAPKQAWEQSVSDKSHHHHLREDAPSRPADTHASRRSRAD